MIFFVIFLMSVRWIKVAIKIVLALSAYVRLVRVCRGTGVRPSDALARVRAQSA